MLTIKLIFIMYIHSYILYQLYHVYTQLYSLSVVYKSNINCITRNLRLTECILEKKCHIKALPQVQ